MDFHTEYFSRPRPTEQIGYRIAVALIHAMSHADRAELGIKPADFPNRGRGASSRRWATA